MVGWRVEWDTAAGGALEGIWLVYARWSEADVSAVVVPIALGGCAPPFPPLDLLPLIVAHLPSFSSHVAGIILSRSDSTVKCS